ncbi:MAG: hypothetical protein ACREOM_02330 [Candidatus Dormibacteraceae bacterium]
MKAVAPLVLILLAGCGQLVGGPPVGAGGDLKLYEASSTPGSPTLSVVDSHSHAIERRLPLGTASSDWTHLYSVNGSALVDSDPRTGTALHTLPLTGAYQLPPATMSGLPGGLSQNGRWLVLKAQLDSSQPPTLTRLLVVNTSFASVPLRVDLHGWFEFDAISNDGQRLYLIEYLSGSDYRVRLYQVATRQLDPNVVFDKSDPKESMTGTRLMGVPSSDGQWLYSVYARQNAGAFIHVLNLSGSFAYCIDLPGSGYSSDPAALDWSLALSPTGSILYAANAAMGTVSQVHTSNPFDATTARISLSSTSASSITKNVQAKELGANAAVVSPNGNTLVAAGSSGLVWVDIATMKELRHNLDTWSISSLALSPDGSALYALSEEGMIAEISMVSGEVKSAFESGAGYPLAIMRVAAA